MVIITLYQPFSTAESAENGYSPREIITGASIRFETLLRIYYLRHSFDTTDLSFTGPLNFLGFMSVNKITADVEHHDLDATRSTLILALKGLCDQGNASYLPRITLRFLKDSMRPEEAELADQVAGLQDEDEDELSKMRDVRGRWAPSVISVMDDPENGRLINVAKRYFESDMVNDQASGDSPLTN